LKYLLDTDICVFALRREERVLGRMAASTPEDLGLSAISLAELYFGALASGRPEKNRSHVDAFVAPLEILPFDRGAAAAYAPIRLALEATGKRIGELDLAIAAIARSRGLTVVTHNTREFGRVEGLDLEDWLEA
jgi:tRNA(fMet)-specific endonuclease VapC